jgi:hypothetical protein
VTRLRRADIAYQLLLLHAFQLLSVEAATEGRHADKSRTRDHIREVSRQWMLGKGLGQFLQEWPALKQAAGARERRNNAVPEEGMENTSSNNEVPGEEDDVASTAAASSPGSPPTEGPRDSVADAQPPDEGEGDRPEPRASSPVGSEAGSVGTASTDQEVSFDSDHGTPQSMVNFTPPGSRATAAKSIMSPELKSTIIRAQFAVSDGSLSKASSILSSHGVAPHSRENVETLSQLISVCPATEAEEFAKACEEARESLASAFPATFTGHRICSREQVSTVIDKLDNSTSSCASGLRPCHLKLLLRLGCLDLI